MIDKKIAGSVVVYATSCLAPAGIPSAASDLKVIPSILPRGDHPVSSIDTGWPARMESSSLPVRAEWSSTAIGLFY